MKLEKYFSSKSGKQILNFAYCWGACIIIAGASLKLIGVSGADIILYIGLSVEVVIFFLAGFEVPEESYKWERVYPKLKDKDTTVENLNSKMEKINEAYEAQITETLAQMEVMSKQLASLNAHYSRMLEAMGGDTTLKNTK